MNGHHHPDTRISHDTAFPRAEYLPPDRDGMTEPGTFEIGLVLAGAVSAGAYVGGVVDFLIEALDAWEQAKETERRSKDNKGDWDVPPHDVLLRVISGTSAGGLTAGISAAALGRKFKHLRVEDEADAPDANENPFFESWVNAVDIEDLLGIEDLSDSDPPLLSLLDSSKLPGAAQEVYDWAANAQRRERPWVADPLRILTTTTNLRGVPYLNQPTTNADGSGQGMIWCQDHLRFALTDTGGQSAVPGIQGDERKLRPQDVAGGADWKTLKHAGIASAAFPGGLRPRVLKRDYGDYDYRQVFRRPDAPGQLTAVKPSEIAGLQGDYSFLAVDGGVMNNEPLELARRILAGAFGRNPRRGGEATRATILVDAFPGLAKLGPSDDRSINAGPGKNREVHIGTVISAMVSALIQQARFQPQDLILAEDKDVYSRFMIAPSRANNDDISRGSALAGGLLGGFGGFLSKAFRVHDYFLGRYNCQRFLERHFVLPADETLPEFRNALFDDWSPALKKPRDEGGYGIEKTVKMAGGGERAVLHLPIIPLVRGMRVASPQACPAWPQVKLADLRLEEQFKRRFNAIWPIALKKAGVGSIGRGALWLVRPVIRRRISDKLLEETRNALQERNLERA